MLLGGAVAVLLVGNAASDATAQPAASSAPASSAPAAPAYSADGFRSARFGMSEAEVRKSIAADFKVDDKAITRETNETERTVFLTVTAPDLLSGAGPARVSYIFGFTKHQLIQVNLLWSQAKKDKEPNALIGPATMLRNYFFGYSFKPESIVRDTTAGDGSVVLFQAADQKGRAVSLAVGEGIIDTGRGTTSDKPEWYLRLSYVENPATPDIYRIKPGAF
jgi:hypothetical protein